MSWWDIRDNPDRVGSPEEHEPEGMRCDKCGQVITDGYYTLEDWRYCDECMTKFIRGTKIVPPHLRDLFEEILEEELEDLHKHA